MNDVYKYNPDIFYPFIPFYFQNQKPLGVYPIIIKDFILAGEFIFPKDIFIDIRILNNRITLIPEISQIFVYRAFLRNLCNVDAINIEKFLNERLEEARDKDALFIRLDTIMDYVKRNIHSIYNQNNSNQDYKFHSEWEWAFWKNLEDLELDYKTHLCRKWIDKNQPKYFNKSANKKRGRPPKVDKTLASLFFDKSRLEIVKKIFDQKGFTINGKINPNYSEKGIIRDIIDILENELKWIMKRSKSLKNAEIARAFHTEFGVIMEIRSYNYNPINNNSRQEALNWFKDYLPKKP